jgi:hypothetical protein
MKIYNQLLDHIHDEIKPLKEDLNIISLTLKGQEGEYMHAEIIAQRQTGLPSYIALNINDTPFFKGEILGCLDMIEPHKMKVRYIAKGGMHTLNSTINESYFKDINADDFTLPFVDPLKHEISSYSPLVKNEKDARDLTPFIFENSIHLQQIRIPFDTINIKIEAKWEQKNDHIINLWPRIQNAFQNRIVETLTPNAFKAAFPKMGQSLGQTIGKKTGYRVFFSKLKEINTQNVVYIDLQNKDLLTIPVKSFKGELLVQATNCFKREETILCHFKKTPDGSFDIQNGHSEENSQKGTSLTFFVDSKYLNEEDGSFFEKDIGKKAIQQALTLALYRGVFSHMSHCIDCLIPFDAGTSLRLGETVSLSLEKKEIFGKIAKLYGYADSLKSTMRIWITISPPPFNFKDMHQKIEHFISHLTAPENVEDIFISPESLTENDFIKSISIKNEARSQEEMLTQKVFTSATDVKAYLQSIPTIIEIDLLNLKNQHPLIRTYQIKE